MCRGGGWTRGTWSRCLQSRCTRCRGPLSRLEGFEVKLSMTSAKTRALSRNRRRFWWRHEKSKMIVKRVSKSTWATSNAQKKRCFFSGDSFPYYDVRPLSWNRGRATWFRKESQMNGLLGGVSEVRANWCNSGVTQHRLRVPDWSWCRNNQDENDKVDKMEMI